MLSSIEPISSFLSFKKLLMSPVLFCGLDPVMNNFFDSNNLQVSMAFFKFILKVRMPKNFTSSAVRIAISALRLFFFNIASFTTCPS